MATTSVSDLKNNLSAWLRKVRAGQSVVVLDRDVPIARIERIESVGSVSERLARLQAQGQVRPPVRPLSVKQLRAVVKDCPRVSGLLEALLDNRSEER
jgi:antitoxin (DNA-binding transcriptional repressor) of toxin-antitoxin stability system